MFTTARRKAAINAAQLEFVERTECLTRQYSQALTDSVQEYDLEATITDFFCLSKQGPSIKIVDASANTTYIEGDDLTWTSVERLNAEEPGWRAVAAGRPTKYYLRRDGGTVNLGFHPKPSIAVGETWTALVPYVVVVADLAADADEPFTVSANPIKSLRPYHRALVHFAAYDLEKLRKDPNRGSVQLQLFETYVERYTGKQQPKMGQRIRLARDYRASVRTNGLPRRYSRRVYP
jgi:hypothetical protein